MRSVQAVKPGSCFRSLLVVSCLLATVFRLAPAPAVADSGCGQSGVFTINNSQGSGNLTGLVVGLNAQGLAQGAVVGATVSASGVGSTITNGQGSFTFTAVPEGTYSVTASMTGYMPSSKVVTISAGQTRSETFQLTIESANAPVASNFASPNGKHFIEGMPGNLGFSTDVAWNGSPGSVRFNIAGTWYSATLNDLGGGMARATLSVAAPAALGACTELTIEVTNGEGKKTYVNTGVHFSPIPGIIIPWYQDNIPWTASGLALSYGEEASWSKDLGLLGSSDVSLSASVGYQGQLKYDLLAAKFTGSLGGSGGFGFEWPVAGVTVLGEGELNLTGSLSISFAGCNAPTITPAWEAGFQGKAGVKAPAVLIVDVIFPPASPAIHFLLGVPVVKDVVGALKLKLYLTGGAGLSGEYEGLEWGDCFLGTTSLVVSGTFGIEGQAALELFGAEAGVYAGGTGTPEFEICPDWEFEGLTLQAYVGVFASAWMFEYKKEVGAEVRFDAGGEAMVMRAVPLTAGDVFGVWRPIGSGLPEWGESNRLVAGEVKNALLSESAMESGGSVEVVLVENVTKIGNPSVMADATQTLILYSAFDPSKPWYAATDIGTLRQVSGGSWNLDRIADDTDAEFAPRLTPVDSTAHWAAWERVSGDVSGATGPGDVAPHLEIVTSRFDRNTGTWSTPIQLTDNSVVDREPAPAIFGNKQGILWVQNQAGDSPGNATNGDSLIFSEWNGSAYLPAQTLWSGQKGILNVSFAADAAGQAQVVFAVDEDGDNETKTDRELYALATAGGVWQAAARLTNDTAEDAVPVLIAVSGAPICVWSAGGTVSYTSLGTWSPKAVYSEYTTANEADSLDGVALPGGAAIAYTVQTSEGVNIVASFYDAVLDKWSLPRQLTQDEHAESALSLACDGTDLVIAYLKTQTERNEVDVEIDGVVHHLTNVPQPARTDLYVLRHELGYDLAIGAESVAIEPENPPPGSAAIIRATLENRGDIGAEDVEVSFYDGDPDSGGTLIETVQLAELLVGGSGREVSINWSIPTTPGSGEVYVVADPALAFDDRDRSNNSASLLSMLPDLAVETGWYHDVSLESVALTARVINGGALSAEASDLSWRLGSAEGIEIGVSAIPVMASGAAYEATYVWDVQGHTPGEFVTVVPVTDHTNLIAEWDETNNASVLSVRIPAPPPTAAADFNADYDVDGDDLTVFESCASGPAVPHDGTEGCQQADFDDDNDVDQSDFAIFQRCLSGENVPADPNCSP